MFATPLDAALHYAAIGWHVFPCRPDKHPHIEKWQLVASVDPAQIESWWVRWPQAHVGVATGLSRLCAIDLDLKPSEGKDGVAAFARLVEQNGGQHGCGLMASTPRGGRHYVYLAPEQRVGSCTDVLPGSGIDVRADGGYVVVPSPASPGREWVVGDPFRVGEGGQIDIGPMPPWVLDLVTTRRSISSRPGGAAAGRAMPLSERKVAAIRRALPHIDNLPRDNWIRVGMALKSTSAREQAYDLWVEWSRAEPGGVKFDAEDQRYQWDRLAELRWDGSEVTIATLFHMAKEGGYVPSLEDEMEAESVPAADAAPTRIVESPFPAHLIDCPGLIGRMVEWMVETSPQPQPALCLASTLVTLGAVLGRRICSPTNLRTNIYALGVGETGCGKEPSIARPATLFAHAGLKKFIGPGEWKSDSGLRSALIAEPAHACLIDEFTKVLRQLSGTQVPPHLAGIKRYVLELFGRASSVHLAAAYADRKVNAPIEIQEPNLGIYGAGVPGDLFAAMDRGAVADGFLNRFLVFFVDDHLPPRRRTGSDSTPPADLIAELRALEERTRPTGLHGLGSSLVTKTGCKTLSMTTEAEALVEEVWNAMRNRVKQLRLDGNPLADLWNRQAEHVVKVALVRVGCDDAFRSIERRDIEWAHELVLWCLERTQGVAEMHIADSRTEALTKRVRRIIAAAGAAGLSGDGLSRATQWVRRGERKEILQTLVESGQILAQERRVNPKGGRPGTRYVAAEFAEGVSSSFLNGRFEETGAASANGTVH